MGQQNAKHRDKVVTLNIEAATNYCVVFKKEVLLAFAKQLKEFSDEEPKGVVGREHVMATAEIVGMSDDTCVKMLDHLYTLFDHEGDDMVRTKSFASALGMLIWKFPMKDRISFATVMICTIGDDHGSHRISRNDLTILLKACTDMLRDFGDSEIHPSKIGTLVESVFMESDRNAKDQVDCDECMTVMLAHPIVTEFYESALDDAEYMMK